MAKLIEIVSRAVWLAVWLAVIARSTQAGRLFSSSPSSKDTSPRERNDDDWKKLGVACVKSVQKDDFSMDMITFFSELKVVSRETDCSEEFRDRIASYLHITKGTEDKKNAHKIISIGTEPRFRQCFKLMKEYFTQYVDKCGYEEKFRKAADFIKGKSHEHFSFTQHETVKSFIEETIFVPGDIWWLKGLLADIDNIPIFERISVETDCTEELTTKLIRSFVVDNVKSSYALGEIRRVNFAIYLNKCGYEEFLSKKIEHMELGSDELWNSEKYPTLYSYCAAIISANKANEVHVLEKWLTKTLSMMRELRALGSISNETQCPEMLNDASLTVIEYTRSKEQLLYELYKDYFTLYLDKCGLGKRFKEVTDNISDEYWDSNQCPTLRNYLVTEFWPRMANDRRIIFKLNQLMAIITELYELKSIPKEAYCTEQTRNKLLMLQGETRPSPKLRELVNAHFALYLRSCGFEGQFEKTIGTVKQISDGQWDSVTPPTLYRYLKERTLTEDELAWILASVEQLSALENMSKETDCTTGLRDSLLEWLGKSRNGYPELHTLFGNYLALYLSTCGYEQLFNNRVEHMKQNSHEHWDSDKTPTLYSLLVVSDSISRKDEVVSILNTMVEFSALETMAKETACTYELQTSLLKSLFAHRYQEDFRIMLKDYFALYLEKCGFEQSYSERVASIQRKPPKDWKPKASLYSLITDGSWNKDMLDWWLPIMKKLSEFDDASKEPDCSEDLKWNILDWLVKSRKEDGDLHLLIKSYFALYLDKCGVDERLTNLAEE